MSTVVVSDSPDPLVGRVINEKYRIQAPLGAGGMGQVYAAEHLILEHLVAIKFLRRELALEPEVAERFAREAKTIAQLNSEHIVRVLDVGHLEGVGPFMVMEHLEGEDLQARLERTGPFPLDEAIRYVLQAAAGLDQAHRKGIVHRDLKPENLFLMHAQRGLETIKLLDFGISKQADASLSRLTQPQVAIGSPNYMAPEQLLGCSTIDARADVWSLGVVLYRLATGTLPFAGQSITEVYAHILHTEPRRPSEVCPGLPRAFDDLVLRCLKKPADERPRNVRILTAALRKILRHGSRTNRSALYPVIDRPSSTGPVSITTEVVFDASNARPRWHLGAALSGLVLASLAGWALASHSLSQRAEPLPSAAGRCAAEPGKTPLGEESLEVVDVNELPLEDTPAATAAPTPSPASSSPSRKQPRSAAPASNRAHPRNPKAEAVIPDFGGRY